MAFAHRGARADTPGNTLAAFEQALRLGATGLESDVRLTSDGVPVLRHDSHLRMGVRRRAVSSLNRAQLPPAVPTLDDLYSTCGADFELSLDVYDPQAAAAVVTVARAAGGSAAERLWLCHGDLATLASWRSDFPEVRLVNSTRLARLRQGPERRAAQLADAGVDAVNLHASDWTRGMVTLFHRFGRLAFGWDAQYERVLRALVAMGIDGVYSDYVERMMAVVGDGNPG